MYSAVKPADREVSMPGTHRKKRTRKQVREYNAWLRKVSVVANHAFCVPKGIVLSCGHSYDDNEDEDNEEELIVYRDKNDRTILLCGKCGEQLHNKLVRRQAR